MNRFVRQCDEIFFLRFYKCGFLWEVVALCIDLLCCDFEKWNKQLCRDKSCQFRPPKKAKKKFLCSNFRRPKVSTVQREVGCSCFPKLASCKWKKSYPFTPAGECVQSVQSLEERLEDMHSLSLKFCLTKFVPTIERAFVQVSHSFANWFPNTRVWISEHVFLDI